MTTTDVRAETETRYMEAVRSPDGWRSGCCGERGLTHPLLFGPSDQEVDVVTLVCPCGAVDVKDLAVWA